MIKLNIEIKELAKLDWVETRKDLTSKILTKELVPKNIIIEKMTLTRVEPGGVFRTHVDSYHHIFYFLTGNGIITIDSKQYTIKPEMVVTIPAGTSHGYENTGKNELMLITINFQNTD
ncbi:MAG: cupin domain-containing protein [Asgard group archaeon]|nr:cupin domain-containing protein [Asgard group archaeon]